MVHQLSQFVSPPTTHHQILRYLKGALGHGIFLSNNNILQLKAFNDSYWATCPRTRKFVTDYLVYLSNSIISWKSNKQVTISNSSFKAEYVCLLQLIVKFNGPFTFLKTSMFLFKK